MNLVILLTQKSMRTIALVVLAGLASGLASAGLLVVINKAFVMGSDRFEALLTAFIGLAGLKILFEMASMLILASLSQEIIIDLVKDISEKILKSPLRLIEAKGKASILTMLTDGVLSISWATQSLPSLVKNFAILAGCAGYLAWMSLSALVGLLAVVGIGVMIHQILHRRALSMNKLAMQQREKVHRSFGALIGGIKELLLNSARREEFLHRDIGDTVAVWRTRCLNARKEHLWGDIATQVLMYGLIGTVIFLFPHTILLTPEVITAYAFTLLYMLNPIWGILGSLPSISQGQAALSHLEDLELSLRRESTPQMSAIRSSVGSVSLELRDVVFSYKENGDDDKGFSLGPLSFHLSPGELVFVIGGNGSGKSTFVKLLTGLYQSAVGEIRLNGRRVDAHEMEHYREHFSAVFADFYVFDRLVGMRGNNLDRVAKRYLEMLQLDTKIKIENGWFSSTALSQGQRKRLALLTAYLEDRPVYVFDEWAADQDPQYKQIFYMKILPDLKSRGKAVVVVTHDDRYFHLGDRVIKLQDGRVVDVWSGSKVPPERSDLFA